MCLIEFSERASYYGCKGPFNNFINRPLPIGGNGAGAVAPGGQFFDFFDLFRLNFS
jgi:POT family proton-dependent oligopeptide transporter